MPLTTRIFSIVMVLLLPQLALAGTDDLATKWPQTDFSKHDIDLDSVVERTARNMPPAVTKPDYDPVKAPSDLGGMEPVVSIEIDGIWRAYPLQILARHQVINDVIGDVPVLITFCPLRKSAAAFERRVGGRTLAFANTGAAADNNILIYDTQTRSWWRQIDGKAVAGDLTGQMLDLIPARLESFAQFKAHIPADEIDQAVVMAPTALSKRPILQTDADRLIIPVGDARAGTNKNTPKDRVIVVGEDDWALSVLQRLGSEKPDAMTAPDKARKPFEVYFRDGTLQVPYEQNEDDEKSNKK